MSALPAPILGALRLGLARVELPAYLQNRAMVVRIGSEVRYEQNHRWAEPLDEALARVLRDSLRAAPGVAAVFAAPFPLAEPRDYDVTVRVLRCEGIRDPAGQAGAQFAAQVEVARADATHAVVLRTTMPPRNLAWDGRDFSALAAALGDAVAKLAAETVAALPAQQ